MLRLHLTLANITNLLHAFHGKKLLRKNKCNTEIIKLSIWKCVRYLIILNVNKKFALTSRVCIKCRLLVNALTEGRESCTGSTLQ